MPSVFTTTRLLATALLFAVSGIAAPVLAAGPSTRVVVPDKPAPGPGGIGLGGCYRIAERLYGPYSMSFCLSGRGSYKVTGGGLACNGSLNWSTSGKAINIRLQRSTCGHGKAWSADSMSCSVSGFLGAVLPKVIVPDRPGLPGFGDLRCTYRPAVSSYPPMPIRAGRI